MVNYSFTCNLPCFFFTTTLVAHFSNIAAGYYTQQTSDVWALRDIYHDALQNLLEADRFLERYSQLRNFFNYSEIVELRDGLKLGVMTIDEAVALAPRGKGILGRQSRLEYDG